jgi:hypothetical protein
MRQHLTWIALLRLHLRSGIESLRVSWLEVSSRQGQTLASRERIKREERVT